MIRAPAGAGVELVPYEQATSPGFDAVFERFDGAGQLRPFAAVLINNSARTISGVALIWTWLEGSREHSLIFRSDGFFLPPGVIAPPGAKRLVTAAFLASAAVSSGIWDSTGAAHYASLFQRSPTVTLVLDTIIFSDGEIVGPDETRTIEYIQARTAAAESLSKAVLAMIARGFDPSGMLTEKKQSHGSPDNFFSEWNATLADMLLNSQDKKQIAEQLAAIPTPSLFRR